ncbi:MAG: tripartite tricarboxylate transporter substrate binding protein, partial [Rubritepida sp.]|nr:tripartite tricarboxylate transporter substrate binding protein [Rubritepida sp.]
MTTRRALGAAALAGLAAPALAQTWPAGPIRFVVPFPPGGSVDTLARLIQQPISAELGVPVVIENRGG